MHGLRRIGCVEKLFGEAVHGARAREAFVEKYRPIGHGFVQLRERRVAVLGPLIRVPTAHRRDPLPLGHVFAPRSERILHFANRRGVLEDRVIARPVSQANDVHVRLDEPGDYGASAEIDHSSAGRWRAAD
jgi:hypothetical protein